MASAYEKKKSQLEICLWDIQEQKRNEFILSNIYEQMCWCIVTTSTSITTCQKWICSLLLQELEVGQSEIQKSSTDYAIIVFRAI